jgi:hypothetical protein
MSKKIIYLVTGDTTIGNRITCEIEWLYRFSEKNPNYKIETVSISKAETKKIKNKKGVYNHPIFENCQYMEEGVDLSYFDDCSTIISRLPPTNIIGGTLKTGWVYGYQIFSYATNVLNIPVCFRLNDSEVKFRDIRQISYERSLKGAADSFNTHPDNVDLIPILLSLQPMDYSKVYWLANGNIDVFDWVTDTLVHREKDKSALIQDEATVKKNTKYLGDDIFFGVNDDYKKMSHLSNSTPTQDSLVYIGFFDAISKKRVSVIDKLFTNSNQTPLRIIGRGSDALKPKPNLNISDDSVIGDNLYSTLNQYVAAINIGKGNKSIKYVSKGIYDCVIARTPILMYDKCDMEHRLFPNNPEFYFSNEKELHEKFSLLKDKSLRDKWIDKQKDVVFSKM